MSISWQDIQAKITAKPNEQAKQQYAKPNEQVKQQYTKPNGKICKSNSRAKRISLSKLNYIKLSRPVKAKQGISVVGAPILNWPIIAEQGKPVEAKLY